MSRRAIFTIATVLFLGIVVWSASGYVQVPRVTFAEAAKIDDGKANETKKKVMVAGRVLPNREIQADGSTVTFYMSDAAGMESKIFYDGPDSVPATKLKSVAQSGQKISVAGHVCGDRFHISSVFFP